MSEPRYPYVAVDVAAESADDVSALLFEAGAQGVEERDATTLIKGAAGKVTLVASFATHAEALDAIKELPDGLNARIEEVVGDAWRDEWKKHFRPFVLCPGIVVRPSWEPYEAKAGEKVLELEPGRAFGTGLHESTALVANCMARLQNEFAGHRVLDVGCGSGILSLVALAMGASHARGVDIDKDAIAVANENAARNGFETRFFADTTDVAKLEGAFPLVLANIEAHVLIPLARAILARVSKGGALILSGVLTPQRESVVAAYPGFGVVESPEQGEWTAIVLRSEVDAAASRT